MLYFANFVNYKYYTDILHKNFNFRLYFNNRNIFRLYLITEYFYNLVMYQETC